MKTILQMTAWTMTPPRPYSLFHILLALGGSASALVLAFLLSRRGRTLRRLFACGLILGAGELYKQLFLTLIVHPGVYDWWYFPFQLCSIPMYLCLLLPVLPVRTRIPVLVFLRDFGLLGGFMALAEPSGLMHSYLSLTLHGFLWHFFLLFIGFTCHFSFGSGEAFRSLRGFLQCLPIYLGCCLIALAINLAAGPAADIAMFYLSPYHPSPQAVFHRISVALGIFPGNVIYMAATVLGAFLIHLILRRR